MKKKKLNVLFIKLGIIAILPISVFAVNNVKKLIGPPVVKEVSDEEIERKLLEEKEEWANTHKSEIGTPIQTYSTEDDTELQNKKKRAEDAMKKVEEIMMTALTRIYPNEFPPLLAEIKELNEKDQSYNLGKITETDYKFYNLIFDAMENNQFTEEETEVFKEFMSDQYNVIKVDENLRNKCEKFEIKHY